MDRTLRRDLGDGLVLRQATAEDAERLAAFNATLHGGDGPDSAGPRVGIWTRDLMAGGHPTCGPADFTVVEDTASGQIVSSLCLISQTWAYEGIPFGVGQPELVGTHPDYRRRGLIRKQMQVIHRWSARRGQLMQGITGIPNYYRQFGYEMALELDGGRVGYAPHVPKLKEGQEEVVRVRPATADDLPLFRQVYEAACRRGPIACQRDSGLWRYELDGRSEDSIQKVCLCAVESAAGEPLGYLGHMPKLWGRAVTVRVYELKPGASWLAATPSVLRYLWGVGQELARSDGRGDLEAFALWLGEGHSAYDVLRNRLPRCHPAYAWYLRLPDRRGFLRHVAPALEARLERSLLPGHSGDLRLSFYRDGLLLRFERGRLTAVEPWTPTPDEWGDAAFPGLTFLQLLTGYRSLAELEDALPDCWAENDDVRVILDALFPRRTAALWWIT